MLQGMRQFPQGSGSTKTITAQNAAGVMTTVKTIHTEAGASALTALAGALAHLLVSASPQMLRLSLRKILLLRGFT